MRRTGNLLCRATVMLAGMLASAGLFTPSVLAQTVVPGRPTVTKHEVNLDPYVSDSPRGGKYDTPNLSDVKDDIKPRPGRPPLRVPLYRRYPPDQVVVGEVGSQYVLTRLELERMVVAKMLGSAAVHGLRPDPSDEIATREWEKLQRQTEDEMLREWALIKTLVVRAARVGLTVTAEEVDAKLKDLTQQALGKDAQDDVRQYNKAIGIERDKLREQVADAILIDEFILREVQRCFTEKDLKAVYDKAPMRYACPPKLHVWQIYRRLDRTMGRDSREYKDLREEFYGIAKKAAKAKGKNFEEMARQYSDDPMTKNVGGDMGWIDTSFPLPEEALKAIVTLKPGDVSRIVETPSGFHVFRVTEIQPAKGLTFDDYARQRVIDGCIFSYKEQMGDAILANAPVPVRLNPSGLRLTSDPVGTSRSRGEQAEIQRNLPRPAEANYADRDASASTALSGADLSAGTPTAAPTPTTLP